MITGSLLNSSFDANVSNFLFSEKMCRAGDDPVAGGSGGEGFGDGGPAAVGDGKLTGSGSVCDDSDLLPRLRALLCRAATADMEEGDPSAPVGGGGDADIEEDWLYGLSAAVVLLLLVLTK